MKHALTAFLCCAALSSLSLPAFAGDGPDEGDLEPPPPPAAFHPHTVNDGTWPVQFDVSGGGEFAPGRRGFGQMVSYVGLATFDDFRDSPTRQFIGVGTEWTTNGGSPYQWSAGVGSRMGLAWMPGADRGHAADATVYFKFLPFLGGGRPRDYDQYTGAPEGRYRQGGGLRVGVGVTLPGWTAWAAQHPPNGRPDAMSFLFCGGAALLNHAEVGVETYGTDRRSMATRGYFRIGTGF